MPGTPPKCFSWITLASPNGSAILHQTDLSKALQSFLWSQNKGKDLYHDPQTLHDLTPSSISIHIMKDYVSPCSLVGLPPSFWRCHVLFTFRAFVNATSWAWNALYFSLPILVLFKCWYLSSNIITSSGESPLLPRLDDASLLKFSWPPCSLHDLKLDSCIWLMSVSSLHCEQHKCRNNVCFAHHCFLSASKMSDT